MSCFVFAHSKKTVCACVCALARRLVKSNVAAPHTVILNESFDVDEVTIDEDDVEPTPVAASSAYTPNANSETQFIVGVCGATRVERDSNADAILDALAKVVTHGENGWRCRSVCLTHDAGLELVINAKSSQADAIRAFLKMMPTVSTWIDEDDENWYDVMFAPMPPPDTTTYDSAAGVRRSQRQRAPPKRFGK